MQVRGYSIHYLIRIPIIFCYSFDPPVEMKRGEHFKVNCTYTTTDATKRTYFGESTSDEMCFAFILMYPIDPSIVTVGTKLS